MNWANDQLEAGNFEKYKNKYVAVLNHQVVGTGKSPKAMRKRMSNQHGVAPHRLVIVFANPDYS